MKTAITPGEILLKDYLEPMGFGRRGDQTAEDAKPQANEWQDNGPAA